MKELIRKFVKSSHVWVSLVSLGPWKSALWSLLSSNSHHMVHTRLCFLLV